MELSACSLNKERELPAHLAVHEISEPEADAVAAMTVIMAERWNLVQQRTADDLDQIEQQVVFDDELPTAGDAGNNQIPCVDRCLASIFPLVLLVTLSPATTGCPPCVTFTCGEYASP